MKIDGVLAAYPLRPIPREQVVKLLRFISEKMEKDIVVLFPSNDMIRLGEHNISEILYFIADMLE